MVLYIQVFNTLNLIQSHKAEDVPQLAVHWKNCGLEASSLNVLNIVLLLVLVPLMDLVIVPILRHMMLQPSILKCLGMGGVLTFMSILSLFALEGIEEHYSSETQCIFDSDGISEKSAAVSVYWLFLPMVLVTIAEIMLYIPSK